MPRITTVDTNEQSGSAVTTLLILVSVVSLVVILVFAYQWWRGEERVIRARLDSLAETLSTPATGELAMVGRLGQLRNYFAPDVLVQVGGQELASRDTLLAVLGRWEPPSTGFALELVDVSVEVSDDGTAQVSLTAKISNTDARSGEPIVDAYEANLTMRKLDGDWVLAAVESAETLKR